VTVPAGFVEALREDLVRAAVRQHRRRAARRHQIAAALGTAACLLVGGMLVVSRPVPARADVRVEVGGGRVVVTLADLEHDPREIEAGLRAAGLHVTVSAAPVGPSEVGRFVGNATNGALPLDLRTIGADANRATFAGFSVPVGWSGTLDLRIGRPARGDEPYDSFTDAFAPGEPLACRALIGRTAAEVAHLLATSPLDLVVEAADHQAPSSFPLAAMAGSDHGHWVVVGADATSRHRVVLRIQPRAMVTVRPPPDPC
jgi:hypothetical protein